ncbi:solute carrier family 15 member 2-like [Procambarus clarkii]|uniref:solute carrier family 15 member 2-like n=1 Tax=Procambarus clarkii TaxID=6728 RepID=UPI00374467CA
MVSFTTSKFTGVFGMLALGICAGLMKPVYSSLGADQFKVPEEREQQKRFFYVFYWMINAGAFVGLFITAQIRDSVQCFGDDCYFLSYIIMAGLMVVSTVIFAVGRTQYKEGPPDKMMIRAVRCIAHAVTKTWDKDRKPVQHWLDRAQDKFDSRLLLDVKVTLHVLLLFCTFPLFWALFYQTSTGMIFQAKRLDGMVGSYRIPPEMSANPLLVLALIPLFDFVFCPFLARVGVLTKTTSRMIAGMCFTIIAFLVYASGEPERGTDFHSSRADKNSGLQRTALPDGGGGALRQVWSAECGELRPGGSA